MKLLLLMRHAHAEDRAATDFDRPLSARGRAEADAVGDALAEANLLPEAILASPALRTATTAQRVAARLPDAPPVQTVPTLYGAGVLEQREALRTCGDVDSVLLVAHNPGVADHLAELGGAPVRCPPATCVAFEIPVDDWANLGPHAAATEVRRVGG
ncbi:SixA phosphatase family protein [Alienimonas sp. DA493]|uniref:SixA phosphatase family protein n=1 Tax=Alienimonas sp. DA493 TaxID=3373605 RepID=UPI003753F1BA